MRVVKSWARAVLACVPSSGQLGCALLLHFSGPKRAKIAAVLERAAVAAHLRILGERLLGVAFRSDLVNVRLELRHGGFAAHVCRRLVGAARDRVARAAKLDEKVACRVLRHSVGRLRCRQKENSAGEPAMARFVSFLVKRPQSCNSLLAVPPRSPHLHDKI